MGIDLASRAPGTAVCAIEWDGAAARVTWLACGVTDPGSRTPLDDEAILSIMRGDYGGLPESVTKVAIDAPFGWPVAFADALAGKAEWASFADGVAPTQTRRATDHWVSGTTAQSGVRKVPLSVSTDRIAFPAMRLAGLFAALTGMQRTEVDKTGRTGRFCEAYPDPAIRAFGLWPTDAKPRASYKRTDATELRRAIMGRLSDAAPWLAITSAQIKQCVSSDDALDALVCALIARAAERPGLTHPIPSDNVSDARQEGWIQLPVAGSLDHLL